MDLSVAIAFCALVLAAYNMSELALGRLKRHASALWRIRSVALPILGMLNSIAGLYFFAVATGPITRLQVLGVAMHVVVLVGLPLVLVADRMKPDRAPRTDAGEKEKDLQ